MKKGIFVASALVFIFLGCKKEDGGGTLTHTSGSGTIDISGEFMNVPIVP